MSNSEKLDRYQATIDALESTLEGRASADQQAYAIQGRRIDRIPIPELIQLHEYYSSLYQKALNEDLKKQGLKPHKIRTIVGSGYY